MSGLSRVVVLHDFSEARGGASLLATRHAAGLARRGVPVTFFAGDEGLRPGTEDAELLTAGERELIEKPARTALRDGLYNGRVAALLSRFIAERDDPGTVYHLHGWTKTLSPSVLGALAPVRDRVVLHAHDYFSVCPNGGYYDYRAGQTCRRKPLGLSCLATRCDKRSSAQKAWRTARLILARRLMTLGGPPARMLMIHEGMREPLMRGGMPGDRLHALRNPVTPLLDRPVRAEGNSQVVFLGRVSVEKGADLAAAAAAAAGMPFVVAGSGEAEALVAQRNPAAVLAGWQSRAGMAEILRTARVAVMPSRWAEPFGLVALEAAGSGVPVVLSAESLLAPDMEREGMGVAVEPRDVPAFAALLERLGADDIRIAAMSRAGPARYAKLCLTPEGWLDALLRHYEEVLQEETKNTLRHVYLRRSKTS